MPIRSFLRGRAAERRAARFLKQHGHHIVARGVRVGGGDIDLVTVDRRCVVFVEVRYRSAGLGLAADSVRGAKARTFRRAVRAYRTREHLWDAEVRGDLVVMTHEEGRWKIGWERGALET